MLLLDRERDDVVRDRTALINRIRASLQEFGVSIPTGRFRSQILFGKDFALVEDCLPVMLCNHIKAMQSRLMDLEKYLDGLDKQIDRASQESR